MIKLEGGRKVGVERGKEEVVLRAKGMSRLVEG